MHTYSTHQGAGVAGIRCVLLQVARKAEIRHFAHQVAVDKDVACSQVPMDVIHFRQIFHPGWDPTHHPHQLDHRELAVILLEDREEKQIKAVIWPGGGFGLQQPPNYSEVTRSRALKLLL